MAASGQRDVNMADTKDEACGIDLSLVRDDVGFRIQRRLGLIPKRGMGIARRAIIFAALTWIPLAVWAIFTHRAWGVRGDDALLGHFGVHIRCLVAIPLLVIAEGTAQKTVPSLLRYFVESGLVSTGNIPQFRALIGSVVRLKDRVLPWVLIFGVVVAWTSAGAVLRKVEDMSWSGATDSAGHAMAFGGWWFVLVIRPLFTALLLVWLWRACLVSILLLKLAKFPLSVVPTHPDRMAGLAFVERLAFIFSPVAFAISAVAAASFAHDVMYHGVNVAEIKGELIATAVLVSVVFLAPFLPLIVLMRRVKRNAIREYGRIVGEHGRLVHRRWILGEEIGSPQILDAPELGPVADVHTLYEAVQHMRWSPISKLGVAAIAVPATVPLLLVAALQLPIQGILKQVLKTLI